MATTIEMPMNTAHQHAANAEDHSSNGLLIPSAEEHLKAAEAYMAAIARTNDDSTRRTLQMLHNEHKRSHLELQRKISRLKEEGKDPNEPQKPEVQRAPSSNSVSTFTQPMSSPSPARPLMESTTVEESFMVLGGQRSDPGDAFNQFWTIMQGMLENLSQPVAFATAPLGTSSEPSRPEEHHSSDTDYTDAEERLSSRLSRKLKLGGKSVKSQLTAGGRGSPAIETSTQEGDFDDDFSDEGAYHYPHCDLKTYPFSGDDLSESFLVIPSEATMRALKQENIALKGQVGLLQHRLEATERVLRLRKEQDHYLRDSILQASKEVVRHSLFLCNRLSRILLGTTGNGGFPTGATWSC
ncbi:hypothetical protein E1B28_008632 [Marasmius oreades]|uniref:Uncharacterized protein n=1 Tax=Marasmius oreades TaxID=181124 RepID=A0A9P7UUH3_9AGAR|nr:uncharacterized protein E1B28_008632 [Marasmius oreades]KAG7092269.1 hypothetical protein E1B28_008632 [Marasmius oreades]